MRCKGTAKIWITCKWRENIKENAENVCQLHKLSLPLHSQLRSWCHSSVGRAKDWKSLCPRFDSWWHHNFLVNKLCGSLKSWDFKDFFYAPNLALSLLLINAKKKRTTLSSHFARHTCHHLTLHNKECHSHTIQYHHAQPTPPHLI